MTTSLDLLDLAHAAIVSAGTDAGEHVYKPGDWPTQVDQYPIIKMRLILEDRTSLGRGGPTQFRTVATIRFVAEVSEPARLDDAGAAAAEASLWALKRQIDAAIINSYPLSLVIQQIASMRSQLAFNSEAATHLAGVQADVALEFYEGEGDFPPPPAWNLDEMTVGITDTDVGIVSDFHR